MVSNEDAARYGFAQAFLKSNKEIRNLVKRAVNNDYSLDRFEYELRATDWYRKRNAAKRDWEVLEKTQPREAEERLKDARFRAERIADQLGVSLSNSEKNKMARNAVMYEWSDEEFRYRVGKKFDYNEGGRRDGVAYQAHQELTELGRQYGIKIGAKQLEGWARQVAYGGGTVEGFRDYIVEKAKGKYVAIAEDLDRGLTVDQLFDPYRQEAAQILGINPDTVDVRQKGYQDVFSYREPGTSKARAMTLDEWGRKLRTDAQYRFDESQNALSMAAELGAAVQQDFGMRR